MNNSDSHRTKPKLVGRWLGSLGVYGSMFHENFAGRSSCRKAEGYSSTTSLLICSFFMCYIHFQHLSRHSLPYLHVVTLENGVNRVGKWWETFRYGKAEEKAKKWRSSNKIFETLQQQQSSKIKHNIWSRCFYLDTPFRKTDAEPRWNMFFPFKHCLIH